MDNKKNRLILVLIVSIMIICVIIIGILLFIKNKQEAEKKDFSIEIKQLYTSYYKLDSYDGRYFFGKKGNKLYSIIDKDSKEIYLNEKGITYDEIFEMEDGNYIIYNSQNNKLKTYIFDGDNLNTLYKIDDISYVKPIIYIKNSHKYIAGFATNKNQDLYIYNLTSPKAVVLNNTTLVADKFEDNKYYINNKNKLVVKNDKNLMGVIDNLGNLIINYNYKYLSGTVNNNFIATNKNDKYGLIDENNNILLKFKYDNIKAFKNNYIIVSEDKMALFNKDYKNTTGFKMNYNPSSTETNNMNEVKLFNYKDKNIVINNYDNINKNIYKYNDMYLIDQKGIYDTKQQISFGNNKSFIYSYDNNILTLYNDELKTLKTITLPNDIINIIKVNSTYNDYIEVTYHDKNNKEVYKTFNDEGKIIKNKYGKLISSKEKYLVYEKNVKNNKQLIIVDYKGHKLSQIEGKNINYYDDFIIVDYGIYKIEVS